MRKFILVAALSILGTASAHADSYYAPQYQAVTTYVYKQVPVTTKVVKYDAYGCPYYATVTTYKTVKVPVTKYVPVQKHVNIYN